MPRALLVGDVHSTPEELGDCQKLIDLVIRTALAQKVKHVVFMGDLYNTHNVMRVEVLAFWRQAFQAMRDAGLKVYALVGNHDYAGEGLLIHALMAHEEQIRVVSQDEALFDGVLMLPYMSGRDAFVAACQEHAEYLTVLCHQTFEGSKYENGMWAPDGVDPNLLPQKHVISGHIHTPQAFGTVTYIGAPRWRTLSDANVPRAIWLVEFDAQGGLVKQTLFDTGQDCRVIRYVEHTPDSPVDPDSIDRAHDWRVDIRGPAEWLEAEKKRFVGPGVRVRTFKTDKATPKVRESEGIDKAFDKFLSNYVPRFGTSRDRLAELARERLQ